MITTVTYADICHQVANALQAGIEGATVQAFDNIQESVAVTPTLHVYPETGETGDSTDRDTFGAGIRVTTLTMKIDGYAAVRTHIYADIPAQIALADKIESVLTDQGREEEMYGMPAIRAHHWSWERGTLDYGGSTYAAVVFTLKLTIF